jgi:tetratricopeptide (TPR) repeat protein
MARLYRARHSGDAIMAPMAAGSRTRATTAGKWVLAIVVPASALAMGSIPPVFLLIMSGAAAAACALLWASPAERLSRTTVWLLAGIGLLLAATALQAVPLPAGIVRTIAPANAEIWQRVLAPLHEPAPTWHPISVAPAATLVELLRGLFYACVFLGALRVASLEGGRTFLQRVVIASSVVMAFVALAHAAAGAERVFGLYRPRDIHAYSPDRYGPLLNTNHLAAYLNIGACVAFAASLARRPAVPRALAIGAALLLSGTSVWAASRGGTGALVIGLLLVAGLHLHTSRGLAERRVMVALPVMMALGAAVMIALGLSDDARQDVLDNSDVSKVAMALNALELVPKAPWLGFGRGSFETVFPSVREGLVYVTFTHPENILAQWTTEWGLPVAIGAAVLLGRALRPSTVLTAARPPLGSWAAIVAIVSHDLVDYHLEVPGVVALGAVCAAMVVGARAHSGEARVERLGGVVRASAWAAAIAVVPLSLLILPNVEHSLAEDRARMSKLALDRNLPSDEFRVEIRSAMLRYPSEAFLPLMGAVRAQRERGGGVVAWVGRALELNPRFGRAHMVLARSLAPRHRAQARLEYRLAYESDVGLRETILKEAPLLVTDLASALELVPEGRDGMEVLDVLAERLGPALPATAAQLDAELLRRQPGSSGALRRRVQARLVDVVHEHPWCSERDACVREGLAAAESLVAVEPQRCRSHVLLAKMRIAGGDEARALDELGRSVDLVEDRRSCLQELVRVANDAGERGHVDRALARLVRAGCSEPSECSDTYSWAGSTEELRGNFAMAVRYYQRAVEIAPEREDLLERIGALGGRVAMTGEAIKAYETLARRHPEDSRWPTRIAELEAALGRARLAAPAVP